MPQATPIKQAFLYMHFQLTNLIIIHIASDVIQTSYAMLTAAASNTSQASIYIIPSLATFMMNILQVMLDKPAKYILQVMPFKPAMLCSPLPQATLAKQVFS